ncbi:DCLRE1C family protein [Megaselia abdita]
MSTFNGVINEFPGIAVDLFEVLTSKLFFLSHCHSDHMRGLLENKDKLLGKIVLSEISAIFVKKQFGIRDEQLYVLKVSDESPNEVSYEYEGKETTICVTLLPAQHCPGSVMFLFQSEDKNILYTGDFRISSCRFEKYSILTSLTLHELYLDSTFLTKEYDYFPTQVESVREICSLINKWLNENSDNKVFIKAPAQYSLEFLLMNIARKCKEKVFVPEQLQDKYIYFEVLDDVISSNKFNSRIFLETGDTFKGKASFNPHNMILKPSALFWKRLSKGDKFSRVFDSNEFRVAYSSHCSLQELKEFIEFLKPVKIFLNVKNSETIQTLNSFWKSTEEKEIEKEDLSGKLEQFQRRLDRIIETSDTKMLTKRIKL